MLSVDCICGEFIVIYHTTDGSISSADIRPLQLVIDKSLASLPRRSTDGAIVIRSQDSPQSKARVFKLNATVKEPVLVERSVPSLSSVFSHYLHGAVTDWAGMSVNIDTIAPVAICPWHINQRRHQLNPGLLSLY